MSSAKTPPVRDVRLVLPDHWWLIPLADTASRARSVQRLVDRQFAGVDDQPLLRVATRRRLLAQAEEAAAVDARVLALSLQRVEGVPVPASLVVHWLDLGVGTADEPGALLLAVEGRLRPPGGPPPGFALDQARLASGPVLRRVRQERTATGDDGVEHVTSVIADYWLERPDAGGLVQFAFATPLVALRPAMLELFDAVVNAVHWVTD